MAVLQASVVRLPILPGRALCDVCLDHTTIAFVTHCRQVLHGCVKQLQPLRAAVPGRGCQHEQLYSEGVTNPA